MTDPTSTPRQPRSGWVVVLEAATRENPGGKLPLLRVIVIIGHDGNATHLIGVTEAGATRLPLTGEG